jgi:hypothetical protein
LPNCWSLPRILPTEPISNSFSNLVRGLGFLPGLQPLLASTWNLLFSESSSDCAFVFPLQVLTAIALCAMGSLTGLGIIPGLALAAVTGPSVTTACAPSWRLGPARRG